MGFGVIRPDRDGLFVLLDRLIMATEQMERIAEVAVGLGVGRIER